MRLIGMARVKNESRWIDRCVRSMQAICESVVIWDDHSTDETPQICRSLGAEVILSPYRGLDEVRDKNALLKAAMAKSPDFILHIDGDEELAVDSHQEILRAITVEQRHSYSLRVVYLWDRPDQIRVDGIYGKFHRPSLFRAIPGAQFIGTGNGGNFHCGNVPRGLGKTWPLAARLLHYGYMHKEDRVKKYEWYNSIKPVPIIEDGYRHMCIGDLFPANSVFRHAGPLALQELRVEESACQLTTVL